MCNLPALSCGYCKKRLIMQKNDIPYIGISGNFNEENGQHLLAKTYVNAVLKAGACPVILPAVSISSNELLDAVLARLDGIIFSGGGDFTPELIGEQGIEALGSINPLRDQYEFPLIRRALAMQIPILGICRGEQLLNLALGGRIYQDLPSEFKGNETEVCATSEFDKERTAAGLLQHSQSEAREQSTHKVEVSKDSLLFSIFNAYYAAHPEEDINTFSKNKSLRVNSFHHQAVRSIGKGLRVSAWGPDGVVEAVESTEYKPIIGVQWHPECLVDSQPEMQALFAWLRNEALLYRQSRKCLEKAISIDLHCDAPMFFEGDYHLKKGGNIARGKIDFDAQGEEALELVANRVDLDKMQDGGLDSIVMAAYIKQLGRDEASLQAATDKAKRLLEETMARAKALPDDCEVVSDEGGLRACKASGRRAIFLGIENAYAIGKDLQLIDAFAQMGVCYITLCHNGHNDVCDSASQATHPEHDGIGRFGQEAVKRMNRAGIIIDLSHASEKSFYDAIEMSEAPIICSHSSAWELCQHRRNLKDEQIKALAAKGGMMGICLYGGFLAKEREATVKDAVAHINYVRDLVGIDYVGIGSDFDGGGGIVGCNHCGEFLNLVRELLREGYSQEDLDKILGGNFLRVLNEVKSFAKTHQHD